LVTLLSIPLGWVGWELDQRRREKTAIAWVEEMGGAVHFRSHSDNRSWWAKTTDKWFGERVRMVYLHNRQLNTISPVAKLKNLEWLGLGDTQVRDLSPLAELMSLKNLFLDDTQVSELSPLAELKNLEWLGLDVTKVSELSSLRELTNLQTLNVRNTQVSDEQVQHLRLALPNCKISF
jgi:Leucine-rich repeat (LRR) protein